MQNCPKCKSIHIGRSRTRSRWERLRREVTRKRPFRCRDCSWRGWDYDLGGVWERQPMGEPSTDPQPFTKR